MIDFICRKFDKFCGLGILILSPGELYADAPNLQDRHPSLLRFVVVFAAFTMIRVGLLVPLHI